MKHLPVWDIEDLEIVQPKRGEKKEKNQKIVYCDICGEEFHKQPWMIKKEQIICSTCRGDQKRYEEFD